ncbi:MAG: AfsR/SARP family transcriptional regulator [Acidimicrobiales bacterium]
MTVEVQVLGRFEIRTHGAPVPVAFAQQRLVAFLALHPKALARGYVAGTLWPDRTDRRAAANLRSTMWRLGPIGDVLVDATPSKLGLQPSVDVDARALDRTARGLLTGGLDGADLPAGDLLPGWDEDWVVGERERLRQIRAHALEALGSRLLGAGRASAAVAAAAAAVAVDPTRESARRLLRVARAACCPAPSAKAAQGA